MECRVHQNAISSLARPCCAFWHNKKIFHEFGNGFHRTPANSCNRSPNEMGSRSLIAKNISTLTGIIGLAIAYYSLCSSCLLIVTNVALHIFPAPVVLLSLQLSFSVAFVYSLQACGVLQVETLRWGTGVKFLPVVLSFLGLTDGAVYEQAPLRVLGAGQV